MTDTIVWKAGARHGRLHPDKVCEGMRYMDIDSRAGSLGGYVEQAEFDRLCALLLAPTQVDMFREGQS